MSKFRILLLIIFSIALKNFLHNVIDKARGKEINQFPLLQICTNCTFECLTLLSLDASVPCRYINNQN